MDLKETHYKLGKYPLKSKNLRTPPSFAGFPSPASHHLIWSVVNHARTEAGRLQPEDCCRLFAPLVYVPSRLHSLGAGDPIGVFLPLTRPSVLGNTLPIMTLVHFQPPCLRALKNGAEVPQIASTDSVDISVGGLRKPCSSRLLMANRDQLRMKPRFRTCLGSGRFQRCGEPWVQVG